MGGPTSLPSVINFKEVLTEQSCYKSDLFIDFNTKQHTSYLSCTQGSSKMQTIQTDGACEVIGLYKFLSNFIGVKHKIFKTMHFLMVGLCEESSLRMYQN